MPKLYDIAIDDYREVTQEDVDDLLAIEKAYAKMRDLFKSVLLIHQELMNEVYTPPKPEESPDANL